MGACHTSERFTPCMSQAFDLNNTHNSFDYQKNMKDFHNTLLKNNVEFNGVDPSSCILPVLGSWDRDMVKPISTNKCPMYKCGKEENFCSDIVNPNNFDSSNIAITLNKVCNSTQGCPLPELTEVYNKEKIQTKCVDF